MDFITNGSTERIQSNMQYIMCYQTRKRKVVITVKIDYYCCSQIQTHTYLIFFIMQTIQFKAILYLKIYFYSRFVIVIIYIDVNATILDSKHKTNTKYIVKIMSM